MSWIQGVVDSMNRPREQKDADEKKRREDIGRAGRFYEDSLEPDSVVYYLERRRGDGCSFEIIQYRNLSFYDRSIADNICEMANADLDDSCAPLSFGPYGCYWRVCERRIYRLKDGATLQGICSETDTTKRILI